VTTQGILRRIQFLIPASVAPGTYKLWLTGTAGTAPFNTLNTPSCSSITVTANVTGTGSLGAAIAGGLVTLVDSTGQIRTTTTASDGNFALDTTGLTPPYLIRVVTTTDSGNFPAGTTLYSVSPDSSLSTHINVSVLTDLLVRSFYRAQGINPDTAFGAPLGGNAAPTPLAEQTLAALVVQASQLFASLAGINLTADPPSPGSLNLISSPFIAFPTGVTPAGLDALLHAITSETVDPLTGAVTAITLNSGTITEVITPVYPGGNALTLNVVTTDSSNNSGSTESFSGLALTPAEQSVVDGINAELAIFASIINTKGNALTGTDLLPTYAPDYLNDGNDSTQDANKFATENAGIVVNSLKVFSLNSLDTINNLADVNIAYDIIQGGQHFSGHDFEQVFKNEGGTWLQYGDQRVGSINANSESRTFQGPGTQFLTDIGAFVTAPTSIGVTGVTVSGGGNIWNNAASGTLTHGATSIENGQTFDNFDRLSQNLGFNLALLPPAGTMFTFNFTTTTLGNRTYTVKNNAFTTEKINFLVANLNAGQGPLSSAVGKTLSYNWILPTTYQIRQVFLSAQVFDGPGNNPATHQCGVSATTQPGTTSTSGSITIPADMSFCGVSGAIQQVTIFLEVDGVNGEDNIVSINYPY
jgi:hypothetical protein